ncbi:MAG: class I SAM-dependent methyltransferase [Planctomycetes bacterium]|nr:class I SAM-dependent methyltransferase [Planctomycetota bacterium]
MKDRRERYIDAQRAELESKRKAKEFNVKRALREIEYLGIKAADVTGRILDIGGGAGHYASLFENASSRIVVDPLYDQIGIKLDAITGVSCVGENLPFPSDSFDFVILRNVADHMLEPDKLLIEACRVLKPSGEMYFMVNIFRFFLKPLFGLMGRLDKPHPLHFTLYDIRRLLTMKTGLRIKRERIAPSGHFKWRLKRILGIMIKKEYYAILRRA